MSFSVGMPLMHVYSRNQCDFDDKRGRLGVAASCKFLSDHGVVVLWCGCRYQYDRTAEFLMSLFDPLVNQLQSLASSGTAVPTQIEVLEGELAWLVYIVGAVVGARGTSRSSEEHELLDGDLCAKVFQVLLMPHPSRHCCAPWSDARVCGTFCDANVFI
jgi:hypothetical protein